jgi:vancomycin aglycone glucosyltransferase
MNVLLAPHGTRGDVQPMVALALALRARGHAVSFVAPDNSISWVRSFGFDAVANGIDVEEILRSNGGAFDSMRWQARHFSEVLIPRLFESVAAAAPNADLIVGAGVQVAAGSVAEARGVPYASAVFCPCVVPTGASPPPTVRVQTLPSWMNRAIWSASRPLADLLLRRPINRARRRLDLPADPAPMTTMLGDLIIVAADRDLAPLPDDAPERIVGTDAWVLDDPSALDPRIEAFLDAGDPPVYIGFGSMVAARGEALVAHAIAAVRSIGARALVAGGWAGLDAFVADADDLLAVRAAPHGALLPRVAAVIHHGGAGTTTAAARAGRPQVVVPHILDQFYWAHRVEALGIGPRALPVPLVVADVLAERLDRAVNDPRIISRSAALGGGIASRNGVETAVELLEALV